jgi:hypothetical protein
MILHQNKELFVNYIRITAQQMKIPAIYVEKDYWVTYALFTTELLSQERFFPHLGITKNQNLEKKEI